MNRPEDVPPRKVTRRSFLVVAGSTVLGTFFLPDLPGVEATAAPAVLPPEPPPVSPEVAEIRRLVIAPVLNKKRTRLVWVEKGPDGKNRTMIWWKWGPEDAVEAGRFYQATRWRRWYTTDELHALLREPGPWLIRRNELENYLFVTSADAAFLNLSKEARGGTPIFTDDPAQAVRVSSEQALYLIPLLMRRYGNRDKDEGVIYFEPVRSEDALKSFREPAPG